MTGQIPPGLIEFIAWCGLLITSAWNAYRAHKQEIGIAKAVKASEKTAAELAPNHGSSAKDQLARIEKQLTQQGAQLAEQNQQLGKQTQQLAEQDLKQKHLHELVKSYGRQFGEHVRTANTYIETLNNTQDDLTTRIGAIERDRK